MGVDPDPNLWDLDPSIFLALRDTLDENHSYQELFQVMPSPYAKGLWRHIHTRSQRSGLTPAEVLLKRLGDQGVCASLLAAWLEQLGLERILMLLKDDQPLTILENPVSEQNLMEGSMLRLVCRATSFPSPIYQWFKYKDELLLHRKPELIIPHVKENDSGIYTCRVHKRNSKTGDISYDFSTPAFVKVIPQSHPILFNEKDESSQLECSSISSQDESISLCNMEIKTSKKSSCFQKEKGRVEIITHPVGPKEVPRGTSLTLTCAARLLVKGELQYQWICNGTEIPGAVSAELHVNNIVEEAGQTSWWYTCKAYYGEDYAMSNPVTINLKLSDSDQFHAVEKLALLIANEDYANLESLSSSNDVKILADALYDMGFNVLSFKNLTYQQMKKAISVYSKMLRPGSYSLVYYGGHGFEFQKQLYLQPVDCGSKRCTQDYISTNCISTDFVLKCIQDNPPALNVLLLDACRDVVFDCVATTAPKILVPPYGNCVIGYATSSSQPAYEDTQQGNSCFVKHLKEYLPQKIKVQDILYKVQHAIKSDSSVKNVQFPFVCSSLNECRTLQDYVENINDSVFHREVPWADISSTQFDDIELPIPRLHTTIVLQFCCHRETFCNGMDVHIYLEIGRKANLPILNQMDFDLKFTPDVVNSKMRRVDHEPDNETGQKCLQAIFEIPGIQDIKDCLSFKITVTLAAELFMEDTYDLGFHPVYWLKLDEET